MNECGSSASPDAASFCFFLVLSLLGDSLANKTKNKQKKKKKKKIFFIFSFFIFKKIIKKK